MPMPWEMDWKGATVSQMRDTTPKPVQGIQEGTKPWEMWENVKATATDAASLLPGTGEAMSAMDAVKNFQEGNLSGAALSALGAIPVVGSTGKVTRALIRSKHETVIPLTQAERTFIKSGEFGEYFDDFVKEKGLKWHERPQIRVYEDGMSIPPQDEKVMKQFAEWMGKAPAGERKNIPPKLLDADWEKRLEK